MEIFSSNKTFVAKSDIENSITISKSQCREFHIGFIDQSGYFIFDTAGEQIHVLRTELQELTDFLLELAQYKY